MKLTLEIPDTTQVDEKQIKEMLAAKLYETGKLSLGQAAELAGMSKVAFAETLHKYDVSLINYPVSEMTRDAAAI
jgi:predicted HTH domain antitoxin